MIGCGTLVNTAAILLGGVLGLLFGKFLNERIQETLQRANGVCVLFIGIAGAMEQMLKIKDGGLASANGILLTVCMVLGAVVGEAINMERGFERFGEWLKRKTHSTGDTRFVDGFVTDTPDLTDEMYADASLHDAHGAWQMIFGVNTLPE